MRDYRSLPAWKRGTSVAHDLCALLSESGLGGTESGRSMRRLAIAIPSLIAEAFLGLAQDGSEAALDQVNQRLTDLARALETATFGPDSEREALLTEVLDLRAELVESRVLQVR